MVACIVEKKKQLVANNIKGEIFKANSFLYKFKTEKKKKKRLWYHKENNKVWRITILYWNV